MIHHPGGRVHCSLRIGLLCGYFSGELITAGRKEGVTELPSSYYFVCICEAVSQNEAYVACLKF
jgi:hypothetical protein